MFKHSGVSIYKTSDQRFLPICYYTIKQPPDIDVHSLMSAVVLASFICTPTYFVLINFIPVS